MTITATRRVAMRGLSLASMLVGLSLGLVASVAAFATFRIASDAYGDIVDSVMLEERGQRALALVSHAVRHAGWTPLPVLSIGTADAASPSIPLVGYDDCGSPAPDGTGCGRKGHQRSDALRVHITGSSPPDEPTAPDGTMTDCGGFAMPMRATGSTSTEPAVNLFYIGLASDGMPQLMCRYPRRQAGRMLAAQYTSGALVRGVETMQLRYGIDDDGDGVVEDFLRADAIHARGPRAWHTVRAVRIAIVMRGERGFERRPVAAVPLVLLRPPDGTAEADDLFIPSSEPDRRRRVFAATVRLRNPSPCREALC